MREDFRDLEISDGFWKDCIEWRAKILVAYHDNIRNKIDVDDDILTTTSGMR